MKNWFFSVVTLIAVLLAGGTVLAQPALVPLSPEEARLVAAHPALADARAVGGGVVIAGVNQFGCAEGAMKLNLALIINKPGQNYVIRTVVTTGTSSITTYMRQRFEFPFPSGWVVWSISGALHDGPPTSAFPIPAGTPVRVQVLLSQSSGKPLWYSELTVSDCDGAPNTTSSASSGPVRIVSQNPTFQPDSADPTRAAKWKSGGKVSYSCAGSGVCTEKLTGKPGKTAKLKQTATFSPATGANAQLGITIVGDFSGTAGLAKIQVTPQNNGSPVLFMNFYIVGDTPNYTGAEAAFLPFGNLSAGVFNQVVTELSFSDAEDGDPVAAGKLKIKAIYIYVVE